MNTTVFVKQPLAKPVGVQKCRKKIFLGKMVNLGTEYGVVLKNKGRCSKTMGYSDTCRLLRQTILKEIIQEEIWLKTETNFNTKKITNVFFSFH